MYLALSVLQLTLTKLNIAPIKAPTIPIKAQTKMSPIWKVETAPKSESGKTPVVMTV